ncbi:MAG TPA: glutamate 5-kinase [Defluviitoga tunisiensis]|nr:glutamate 5-kinase [Defluviitoga tunisiensis]
MSKIVIKVGSSSLSNENGIDEDKIRNIVEQVSTLKKVGKDIVIVSSGAIAAGMAELGYKKKPSLLIEKQACAAIGQGLLISTYNKHFNENNLKCAQILITGEDFANRRRYLNAYNTINQLLKFNIIPIINENDTTATLEIKFGDNDVLSAQVASLIEADLLIILSDVSGLLKNLNDPNSIIRVVEEVNLEIENLANGKAGKLGTGGMNSKIKAAKISLSAGIPMVIAPSYEKDVIIRVIDSIESNMFNIGTTFIPKGKKLSKRKRWINFSLKPKGEVIVDEGAQKALLSGKSLLAVGINEVKGVFIAGDLVRILNEKRENIGKGLVNYSSEEIKLIIGKKTEEIHLFNEKFGPEEIIHRDNMVIEKEF